MGGGEELTWMVLSVKGRRCLGARESVFGSVVIRTVAEVCRETDV